MKENIEVSSQHTAKRLLLTQEQQEILNYVTKTSENVKIQAFAGSGKTFTLRQIAQALPYKRFLYLAFNKSVQLHAEQTFPPNVKALTAHALAYRSLKMWDYPTKLSESLSASELISLLKITEQGNRNCFQVLLAVKDFIKRFLVTDEDSIQRHHFPIEHLSALQGVEVEQYKNYVFILATRYYDLMSDLHSPVPLWHDVYLKMWQLKKETLRGYEIILFDEAQDANPLLLDIVNRQPMQLIFVGDPHQQIYAWRGAVNAMSNLPTAQTLYLTESFRFGSVIAHTANSILKRKNESHQLKGQGYIKSSLKEVSAQSHTVLCRTNVGVFEEIFGYLQQPKPPLINLVGDFQSTLDLISSCYGLFRDDSSAIRHPQIRLYHSWQECLYSAQVNDDLEMLRACKIVQSYKDKVPSMVKEIQEAISRREKFSAKTSKRLIKKNPNEVLFSTAHKAKGLELNNVRLGDDFTDLFLKIADDADESEINLLYVATTRAIETLHLSESLSQWIDRSNNVRG